MAFMGIFLPNRVLNSLQGKTTSVRKLLVSAGKISFSQTLLEL